MRVYLVNTKLMCNKHLLEEHYDIHLIVKYLKQGYNFKNHIKNGLVDISVLKERHDLISKELQKRGIKPKKSLKWKDNKKFFNSRIDIKDNILCLMNGCFNCEKRILKEQEKKKKRVIG